MRNLGLWRSFGHVFGSGLANELLDRLFPAPPTRLERFIDKFTESMLAVLPYVVERMAPPDPKPTAKPVEAAPPVRIRVPPPPYKVLGQFTCPKCGGHTWGWTGEQGRDENGTYVRECHGHIPVNPGVDRSHRDFGCSLPCRFTWKATEDHLYFAPPTADDHKRSEPQTCDPPPRRSPEDEAVQVAISKQWPSEPPPPIDALGKDLASLRLAVGDRAVGAEPLIGTAARLIAEADAYIAKQAEQIRGLILDNEFGEDCGEFGVRLSSDDATAIGFPNYAGQVVPIVINGGHWSVRIAANLYPVKAPGPDRKAPAQTLGTGAVLQWATFALDAARRSDKIEFPSGSGEFSVMLNPDIAHGWGMRPGRVAVVLNDGKWSIRNGTSLEPIKWNQAYLLLEEIEHAEPDSYSVVGGKTLVPADAQLVAAQEAAKRSVVGGKVPLQESVEVAAFVDDAEKEKQDRERASEEANRRWQEYARRAGEEKYDAADKQIDETEMAQNAAGGVA